MLTPSPRIASNLVVDEGLWPDDFGFDEGDAAELDAALVRLRPRQVLQVGSGATTLILAEYARLTGAQVVVLEPVPNRRSRTLGLCAERKLLGLAAIDDCGVPGADVDPTPAPMPPLEPDFVVVGGQCLNADGLAGMLDVVSGFVGAGAPLWVSRGLDPEVNGLVTSMARRQGWTLHRSTRRYGLLSVTATAPVRTAVDADRVVVTVLTGGRPSLLAETLDSVLHRAQGLLETAHVIAFHNGNDPETASVLNRHEEVIDERTGGEGPTVCIGEAISELAGLAVGAGRPYWLHLEDDWAAHTWEPSWLQRACAILDATPDAHQVRLRHIGDRIQRDNFVTGQLVTWDTAGDVRVSNDANWTFNPALVRTSQIPFVYPVAGEANAVRKATAAGLTGVVQLLPGVFHHLGHGDSLRRRTHCSA